jgi:hypothetical protein
MGGDYMVRRTACCIFPYVRRTKYSPPHMVHMLHDIAGYIESAHSEPIRHQYFIAFVVLRSAEDAEHFSIKT